MEDLNLDSVAHFLRVEKKQNGLPIVNLYNQGVVISSLSLYGKWSVLFPDYLPFLVSLVLFFLRNPVSDMKCANAHNVRVIADWLLVNVVGGDGNALETIRKLLIYMFHMSRVI